LDSDCDCDSDPDADTDRYSIALKNPFLFGKDFQVSSTDGLVREICAICGGFKPGELEGLVETSAEEMTAPARGRGRRLLWQFS